ncbi:contact-dependent growth inhibition system immunity protein [Streptomyces flavidovirens]|uniref:contact-dependent growth inhibition system immunity protein n=1 Tax=Streptomyces flavidovirens TaxID=67298 RepID=UPI0036A8A038
MGRDSNNEEWDDFLRWRTRERSSAVNQILVALQNGHDWRSIARSTSEWGDQRDLRGIPFQDADLRDADLRGANLSSALLRGARLDNADLSESELTGADFTGASLRNAKLSKSSAGMAKFTECDLSRANLDSALLARAVFIRANLSGARLRQANLAGAILDHANLTNSDFEGATLISVRVDHASLSGANMKGTRRGRLIPVSIPDSRTDLSPRQRTSPMSRTGNLDLSLEELDGERWPPPPDDATSLVRAVHALRRRPIGSLKVEELRRLVGQGVGLPWLLPLAVDILEETAPAEAAGEFYDDDLLSSVVTRSQTVWIEYPELARRLRDTVTTLRYLSSDLKAEVDGFLASLPEDL